MPDATLLEMFNQVRGYTVGLANWTDTKTDAARFAPAGTNNTILWHAGHVLVVVEHLVTMRLTGSDQPRYPAGWFEKFGWDSEPAAVTSWPPLAEVVAQLKDQQDRVCKLIETTTPEQLDHDDMPTRPTVRGSIVHGLHDEAKHQGEMHLLWKLWKLTVKAAEPAPARPVPG
jgi:hypothetical protein